MSGPLLILDVSNAAWRGYYSIKAGLSHDGEGTEVLFSLLRDIPYLQEKFDTPRVAFAFDVGKPLRCKVCPTYKAHRNKKELTEEEVEQRQGVRRQIYKFRKEILPEIGFNNTFAADGYEADDIIASLCQNIEPWDEAVVVSTDKDLFQLVRGNIRLYRPGCGDKSMVTLQSFYQKYGILPERWSDVLAATGCDGDGVIGVKGIGEKYALDWVKKQLKRGGAAWQKIYSNQHLIESNVKLVKLPYAGTPNFTVREDFVTQKSWRVAMQKLGMESLETTYPKCARR